MREDVQLSVEESVDRDEWAAALALFEDASIYQAWDYPNVVYPKQQPRRLIFRRGEEAVALAQARIVTLPLVKRGIAHVAWGPLWRRKGRADGNGLLRPVLESLRQEFASRMRLVLRVVPNAPMEESTEILSMLAAAGFVRKASAKPHVTSVLDLTRPLEAIRKALHQKWRNCLNRAEKNGLHYTEGSGDRDYRRFLKAYRALRARKQFDTSVDAERWVLLQQALSGKEKMRIFLAYNQGRVAAGAVVSAMGETGIYLLGATTAEGLELKASYLLQWKVIEYLKSCGIARYDLGGIDPAGNPGVYRFKSRMGGEEVSFPGTFECCESRLSRAVVQSGQTLRRLKAALSRRRAS